MIEKSLILFKTDVVQRGIVGEILHRFERSGLKICAMKMLVPQDDMVKQHYNTTDENLIRMGSNTLKDAEAGNFNVKEKFGTDDALEIGKKIWEWNNNYLSAGPVIAMVLEGPHAIANVRRMLGTTLPSNALPGTIRGDFGLDSALVANERNRSIYNMMHASGNKAEADFEINLWFKPEEILSYKRLHEDLYSYS